MLHGVSHSLMHDIIRDSAGNFEFIKSIAVSLSDHIHEVIADDVLHIVQ